MRWNRLRSILHTCKISNYFCQWSFLLLGHRNGPHCCPVIFSQGKEDGLLVFNHTKILPQESMFLKFVRAPITLWFVICTHCLEWALKQLSNIAAWLMFWSKLLAVKDKQKYPKYRRVGPSDNTVLLVENINTVLPIFPLWSDILLRKHY